MAREVLRVGLADDLGQRSRYWKVVVDRETEVYLIPESIGRRGIKVSLHSSGRFHLSMGGDREHWKWKRPDPQQAGFIRVLNLGLLPGVAMTVPAPPGTRLFRPAPPGEIRFFAVYFEHREARLDTWMGKRAMKTELVKRLTLEAGHRLCIVTHIEPFHMHPQVVVTEASERLGSYVNRTDHGRMGITFGDNPDGSRWIIEGPLIVARNETAIGDVPNPDRGTVSAKTSGTASSVGRIPDDARARVAALARQHLAGHNGVSVDELRVLRNTATGEECRVDIVIEGTVFGRDVTVCVEVADPARSASVTWVKAAMRKHELLQTNLLVLVSRSGFTKAAETKLRAAGSWVKAMTPDALPDALSGRGIFSDQDSRAIEKLRVVVARAGGDKVRVNVAFGEGLDVYDRERDLIGSVEQLARLLLRSDAGQRNTVELVQAHPDKDQVTGFSFSASRLPELGHDFYLLHRESGEYQQILEVGMTGSMRIGVSEFDFRSALFDGYDALTSADGS